MVTDLDDDKGQIEIRQDDEYKYYNFRFEEENEADIFTSNTLFLSKKDGKYGFVDKEGNVVVDYIYDDATNQNAFGYAGIKKDGKWGSIDRNGNVVQEPTYDLEDYLQVDFIGSWYLGKDLNMNYYRKQIRGESNGTKDKLPIHIFPSSICNKRRKIPEIYIKNVKR